MRKLLIANRGEIARRIMRTAHRMGLETVAVYSDADAHSPHVQEASQAVALGHSLPAESYLRADLILSAARRTGADAIHPGYGFLSENANFAEKCADTGIVFVGPPPAAIRAMGLKDQAKKIMKLAGVPVVPGYQGDDQSLDRLQRAANASGYPVLIKAVAGGGGKGMRLVERAEDFAGALRSCQGEAQRAFGNDHVLLEKWISTPRHIEVQIFADTQGNVVHLFERDCSVQRRHQKIIEEAPAPNLPEALRTAMTEAAVKAAQAIRYVGAGTIEFIVACDEAGIPTGFYFMEMNTRLQVEHPITEMITGEDLVAWQLQVARGEPLPKKQSEITRSGHALEARLYAEDPDHDFLPSTGSLHRLHFPEPRPLLRIESGVVQGSTISTFYDPMIAKIIAHGPDRRSAIETLVTALDETIVEGVHTNRAFLARVLGAQAFRDAQISTAFLAHNADVLHAPRDIPDRIFMVAALALITCAPAPAHPSIWSLIGPWRLNLDPSQPINLSLADGPVHTLRLTHTSQGYRIEDGVTTVHAFPRWRDDRTLDVDFEGVVLRAVVIISPASVEVRAWGQTFLLHRPDVRATHAPLAAPNGIITAPMPGRVLTLAVKTDQPVAQGDVLLTLEAMKMEQRILAPLSGVVTQVCISADAQVYDGQHLLTVESTQP